MTRKRIVMALLLCGLTCGLLTTALAGQGPGGAVKTGLYERMPGDDPNSAGTGEQVGFAIANTDPCDEILHVLAKLDYGPPSETFDVYVKTNGAVHKVGEIVTNVRGKGVGSFFLDISAYITDEGWGAINVQVVVKPTGSTALDGFAGDTVEVPIPPCDCCDNQNDNGNQNGNTQRS